jgi:hypothetical protein
MKNQKVIVAAAILILVVSGLYFLLRNRKREGAVTMSGDYVTQDVYNQLKQRLQGFETKVYDISANVVRIEKYVKDNQTG